MSRHVSVIFSLKVDQTVGITIKQTNRKAPDSFLPKINVQISSTLLLHAVNYHEVKLLPLLKLKDLT